MKIGKYQIFFFQRFWFQTYSPVKMRKFLFMTICWPARSTDIDKKQEFPIGTPLVEEGREFRYPCGFSHREEGRVYRYYKASEDIPKGRYVAFDKDEEIK